MNYWMTKQKRHRQRKVDMGQCRECSQLAAPGSTRCRYHLEKLATQARKRRQNKAIQTTGAPK